MTTTTAATAATAATATPAAATSNKCLSVKEVAARFGVNPATVRAWVRARRFPRPLACSPDKWLWPAATVEEVLGRPGITRRRRGER